MTAHVPSVLIAEDSPTQRAQLVGFLTQLGYSVSSARSGGEAYAIAVEHPPDIVISDILMPGMDGYELCQRIKSTAGLEETPVILVTSLSQPQDVLAGLEAGADSFIIKPYDEQILSSRITYLLKNRRLRRSEISGEPLEVEIGGERHHVTARRQQILDLLISTYAQAVHLFSALDQGRQELSQSYEVLRALYDMTDGLNRCHTPSDVATVSAVRSLGIPGVRDSWLYLREDDAMPLASQHHQGRGGPRPDPFPPPIGGGEGSEGVPLIREFESAWGRGALWHHASMALRLGQRTVGYLHLAGPDLAISDEVALRTLAGVASQISIALERATLHTHLENEVRKRTQRLQEEVEERRQATETISAIFNASPVALVSLDSHLRLATWNRAARNSFHIDEATARGKPWTDFFSTPPRELERAAGTLRSGMEVTGLELRAALASGTERMLHVDAEPLIDTDGEFRGAVIAIDDITDRRQVMEQLHQAQKMEAVGNLTGGIAHDFNNLLTSIIGNLDLALLKLGAHAARTHLDIALRASLRGSEVSRKLLAFARKQPLEPSAIDVAGMMGELRILLESTLGSRVRLSILVPPNVPKVYADPVQLESAIMNLAINGRDAMPSGGSLGITVSTGPLDDPAYPGQQGVVFAVADTGTGIQPAHLERIFEPFFTTKEKGKGTGLGLAMVYGFTRQSGGSITVDSEMGTGTTFRLTLPAMSSPDIAPPPVASVGAAAGGRAILLVEANEEIRDTIRATLEGFGHVVQAVGGADEALAAIDTGERFEVLLAELGLQAAPSGCNLADRVTERLPDCRVLLMSSTAEAVEHEAKRGAYTVLGKPFRINDLQKAITDLFS